MGMKILDELNDKQVSIAIERLNSDASREKAGSDIVKAATCVYCSRIFPMQPQDYSRAVVHALKMVCHREKCRREHTKAGRATFASVNAAVRKLTK